ncbi:MAG TPA: NAD-dependent epimerase/dehydratase family protein [Magnetospirillaceae bacterium]|nr:NAD-dependent epimerase/dehydratase family protein [Magnetospirillaceae bacterium]
MKTVAVTGANGFLGRELVRHLSSKGWQVVALVRKPKLSADPKVRFEHYDMEAPIEPGLLDGVDVLVHAAFIKYDAKHPDAMEQNIEATRALLAAAKKSGVKKCIFISSMSAHDEAVSVYGRQKLATEKLFDAARDVVLRCGLIMGKGGIVRQMAQFMRSKHVVPLIGGGKQPLQVIGVYNLVELIEKAAKSKVAGRFVAATPQVYTYKQFYQALAKALKTPVLYMPIPYGVLLAIFRTASALRVPLGVGEDNLMGLKMLRSMKSAKDLKKLGMQLDDLPTVLSKISI